MMMDVYSRLIQRTSLSGERFFKIPGGFDTAIGNSEDVDLGIRLHLAGYRIEYTDFRC